MTPAAIRRHLDALVEEGLIASRYDELAMHALRFLAQTGGDDAIKAFAQQRVSFIERDYAAVAAANPDFSPAQVLAKVLSDEGYEAGVRHLPLAASGEQLCQQHCMWPMNFHNCVKPRLRPLPRLSVPMFNAWPLLPTAMGCA